MEIRCFSFTVVWAADNRYKKKCFIFIGVIWLFMKFV